MAIRVLLADDDSAYRFLVRELLADDREIEVVGEAGDRDGLLGRVAETKPDVVLLDQLCHADDVDVVRALAPRTRVVILSGHEPEHGDVDLAACADGYVVKGADLDVLRAAIRG